MQKDLETVRRFFEKDKFVKLSGIVIESVSNEEAVVSAEIGENHLNANGSVQGGMLYTLADFAFAVLSNYKHPITVTQVGNISYVRPAFSKKITATARETDRAGHTCLCEVTVKGDDDTTLCVAHFNGFVKEIDETELRKKYER